jgi:hypothetical protein
MDERWALHGATGYEVSTLGRIRKPGKEPRKTKRIGQGYVGVNLVLNGKHRTQYVHRMVLEAFAGDAPGRQASHINGDRTDNRLDNLAWETVKQNAARRRSHGTSGAGQTNAMAKLRLLQAVAIKHSSDAARTLAERFGVTVATINDIRAGRTWGGVGWTRINKLF